MASQGVSATSRLAQMQMRFQKKQLQEREQKRTEISGSMEAEPAVGPKSIVNGKVRQMFDERRRGAGIDRSNLLKPIAATTKITTMPRTSKSTSTLHTITSHSSGVGVPLVARKKPALMAARQPINVRRSTLTRSEVDNRSRDLNFNHSEFDSVDNGALPKQLSSMSLTENRLNGSDDRQNNSNNNNNISISREVSPTSIKLNPVVTKKSPSVAVTRAPARQVTPTPNANRAPRSVTATTQKSVFGAANVKTPPKSTGNKMAMSNMVARQPALTAAGMSACRFCNRHFNEDRLTKHEQICQKMMSSKRKIFDASKHRVKGTEAEQYVRKPPTTRASSRANTTYSSAAAVASSSTSTSGPKKNNWRKKHEDFITAIRAAKQVQSHLARGGKLSDLPPPPPSENPDYIQCPHCLRRFNEAAAERHIPRCANMQHNKPKPGSSQAIKKR